MSQRHSMRKVRETLRLKHGQRLRDRRIGRAIGVARSTAGESQARAEADGLTWEIAETLGDADVEARLFRKVGQNDELREVLAAASAIAIAAAARRPVSRQSSARR